MEIEEVQGKILLPLFELPFQKRDLAVPVVNNELMVVLSS